MKKIAVLVLAIGLLFGGSKTNITLDSCIAGAEVVYNIAKARDNGASIVDVIRIVEGTLKDPKAKKNMKEIVVRIYGTTESPETLRLIFIQQCLKDVANK